MARCIGTRSPPFFVIQEASRWLYATFLPAAACARVCVHGREHAGVLVCVHACLHVCATGSGSRKHAACGGQHTHMQLHAPTPVRGSQYSRFELLSEACRIIWPCSLEPGWLMGRDQSMWVMEPLWPQHLQAVRARVWVWVLAHVCVKCCVHKAHVLKACKPACRGAAGLQAVGRQRNRGGIEHALLQPARSRNAVPTPMPCSHPI